MWLRSYRMQDEFERLRPVNAGDIANLKSFSGASKASARMYQLEFHRGRIYMLAEYLDLGSVPVPVRGWTHYVYRCGVTIFDVGDVSNFHGFALESANDGTQMALIPIWAPVCLFALLPAFWLHGAARRIRWRSGFCTSCGYDLRATPQRCPECGAVTEKI
jgi:hypothetical protein